MLRPRPTARIEYIDNLRIAFTMIEGLHRRELICDGRRSGHRNHVRSHLLAFTITLPTTVSGSPCTLAATLIW